MLRLTLLVASALALSACSAPVVDDEGVDATGSEQVARRSLPSFDAMLDAYPSGDAKTTIGGKVDAKWITNLCTIRVSHSLNEAGFLLPKGPSDGLNTVTGANGKNYAYRVRELDAWLRKHVGPPSITVKSEGEAGVDRKPFEGRRGIIVFDVATFATATGHFDLWNAYSPAGSQYFSQARSVSLWEAPSDRPLPEPPTPTVAADAGAGPEATDTEPVEGEEPILPDEEPVTPPEDN